MRKILSSVAAAISPNRAEAEEELAFARMLVSHIQENAPQGCEAVLTGSMAKGTFLRDKRDIDIFVLFDRSVQRSELEPHIKRIMEFSFPTLGYQLSYAEHPYVRFHFEGRRIDLVPAYRIDDAAERQSAVDRSVLHTVFVLDNLKEGQRADVLLTKQFLRAAGLYGAEIRVEGLSGYLCELLIIRYGSFRRLVRAISKWKPPVLIDLKKYYKARDLKALRERFRSDFIVVDPTDRNRNVAAAVSPANLKRLVAECRAFVRKPTAEAFFRKRETFEEQAARLSKGKKLFLLSMPRPDVVDDIMWGQLHKLLGQLKPHLADFSPASIFADDSQHIVRIAFVLGRDELPKTMEVEGPPLKMKEHVSGFKKSHKRAKFKAKKGKIWATVRRPVTKASAAIMEFFRAYSKTRSHLAYPEEMLVLETPKFDGRNTKRKARKK
ncbi:MAG: CCA tRNA nucleotidyltransferase [Candidatus Micrarchaeota archaeon]